MERRGFLHNRSPPAMSTLSVLIYFQAKGIRGMCQPMDKSTCYLATPATFHALYESQHNNNTTFLRIFCKKCGTYSIETRFESLIPELMLDRYIILTILQKVTTTTLFFGKSELASAPAHQTESILMRGLH